MRKPLQITWNEDDEVFRAQLRGFLDEHRPGKPPKDQAARLAWQKAWAATKVDHGFAGPSWPTQYGGMDLSFPRQVIYQQEMARTRVPAHPGTGIDMVGPTLIKYGTDAQRERYLRPMLRADELWAQGFSEPSSGSDLPSLRTTARRDGDVYVINGQKVWNTNAEIADMFFALVRTGSQESRQRGISYLLIDAKAPGVTVRPLRDLTGGTLFCEIFFDDAEVPVANRVGDENEGWQITRTTLGHERSAGALNQGAFYRRVLDELIELARERGVTADPGIRRQLADFDIRARLMQVNSVRAVAAIIETGEPGASSSISRLYNSEFEQELHVFATDLLGAHGALAQDDPDSVQRGRWVAGMLRTRASTIGAGTAEIQRNTIAEQVLGLPRDPAMPAR
jgi:alkylation response protein AidB-like acyl-CoA dehydrogenase